ncbi:MAG: hypothetical protein ACPG8A_01360 [Psychrobium sp.]
MTEQASKQRSLYPWLVKAYMGLANDYSQQRLHHALLLSSAKALGKSQLVCRLAELIHCQEPAVNKACGQCQNCQLHLSQTHADFYRVEPLEGKSQISIEQVRALSKKIMDTGLVNQRRVVFINGAEQMTESAANALLKILEEPPKHVYFILTTSHISRLPATILSRCYKLALQQPPLDKLMAWLARKTERSISQTQFSLLGHSPISAIEALEDNRIELVEQLCCASNTLYIAWQRGHLDHAYACVIELTEQITAIANHKTNPIALHELCSMLQQINHWILKGQMVESTPIEGFAIELFQKESNIDVAALLDLGSELAQLRLLMQSNTGVNGILQLQNLLIKATDNIIN